MLFDCFLFVYCLWVNEHPNTIAPKTRPKEPQSSAKQMYVTSAPPGVQLSFKRYTPAVHKTPSCTVVLMYCSETNRLSSCHSCAFWSHKPSRSQTGEPRVHCMSAPSVFCVGLCRHAKRATCSIFLLHRSYSIWLFDWLIVEPCTVETTATTAVSIHWISFCQDHSRSSQNLTVMSWLFLSSSLNVLTRILIVNVLDGINSVKLNAIK